MATFATYEQALARQKEVTDRISTQVRTLAISILAFVWLMVIPGKDGLPVLPHPANRILLLMAGAAAFLALVADFLQYVASYRVVKDALDKPLPNPAPQTNNQTGANADVYEYDYKGRPYHAQVFCFSLKQWLMWISTGFLVLALLGALFGGSLSGELSSSTVEKVQTPLVHDGGQPSSVPPSGILVLSGDASIVGWSLRTAVFAAVFVLGGLLLLLLSRSAAAKAVGATLLTVGAITGAGFTLLKDVKFESLVKFDIDKLFEYKREGGPRPPEQRPEEPATLERLAYLDRFVLGDDSRIQSGAELIPVKEADEVTRVVRTLLAARGEGRSAVLLVIGATDRLPIAGTKGQQFEANVGLARARAEVVKRALVERCKTLSPSCDMSDDQIITLVSGPRNTPRAEGAIAPNSKTGFPEDRRVDVWAFWTSKPVAQSTSK